MTSFNRFERSRRKTAIKPWPGTPDVTATKFGHDLTGRTLSELDTRYMGATGLPMPVTRKFYSNLPQASDITTNRVWHVSFQGDNHGGTIAPSGGPTNGNMLAGNFDAGLQTFFRGCPVGSNVWISPYHEPENATKNNTGALFIQMFNYFQNLLKTTSGVVANIQAGPTYMFNSWTSNNYKRITANWWPVGGTYPPDFLGVDFDGPTPNDTIYPDLTQLFTSMDAFLSNKPAITRCAPEWAHKVIASAQGGASGSGDPTHSGRAAWMSQYADLFKQYGFTHAVWWGDPGVDAELTTSNEIQVLANLCQGN